MSEDGQYFTIEYSTPLCSGNQITVVKASSREEAEARFKYLNPRVEFVKAWGE